ncbi:MAG: DUF2935 domain-containing protein [Sporomusaceae bacterium]|jgi:hypothetical protein|nr:DUF2935 domain-containing protein [Sporomusaceae bacterium]
MPRHQNAQSTASAVPPLNAEEVKFWLKIMEEHAVFIKDRLPGDQAELLGEVRKFQQEFKSLRLKAEKVQNEKKFLELTGQISTALKEYIRYKRHLLSLALTGRLFIYPFFLDHLVREAEYFLALLSKLRSRNLEMIHVLETDFWLRVMSDHTHLLKLFVDPAEKGLATLLNDYVGEFDSLAQEARIFTSMFYNQPTQFPVFERFLKDSRSAAVRLRDFKKIFAEMVGANRVITTASELLADHMRREADHFLLVITMMEKGVVKNSKFNEQQAAKYHQYENYQVEREQELEKIPENSEPDLVIRENETEDIKPLFSLSDQLETSETNFFERELYLHEEEKDEPPLKHHQFVLVPEEEKAQKSKEGVKWPRQLGKLKNT